MNSRREDLKLFLVREVMVRNFQKRVDCWKDERVEGWKDKNQKKEERRKKREGWDQDIKGRREGSVDRDSERGQELGVAEFLSFILQPCAVKVEPYY